MCEENISQELGLKNIDEKKNYLIEEINRNEFISKNHRKVCTTLNFSACNYWMYFNFHFCFFDWYSYRN